MNFKVDENLPSEFAAILQTAGFNADTVSDEGLSGAHDSLLAQHALRSDRVLITLDVDFANIRSYPPASHAGIVVLRPDSQDKESLLAILRSLLPVLRSSSLQHKLWIVERDRVRIREN